MKIVGTTKLSSRGQVVIPEILRKAMKLMNGDKFYVAQDRKGNLVLKKIKEKVDEIMGIVGI